MYNEDKQKYQLMQAIIFFMLGVIGMFAMIVWAAL
jgi:hypothetical protein